jgi:hypothetical protein
MQRRGLIRLGGSVKITQDNLLFWLESKHPSSYSGAGTTWKDLVNGKNCTLIDMQYNPTYSSIKSDAINEYININSGLNIPSGDFTFGVYLQINEKNNYVNPGFFRTQSGSPTFFIFQSTTGRPWVRVSGTDILKPSSGYTVSDNQFLKLDIVFKSGQYLKYYENGVEIYHVNTSVVFNGDTLSQLNSNASISENIWADFRHYSFYSKALSANEISQNYNNISNYY